MDPSLCAYRHCLGRHAHLLATRQLPAITAVPRLRHLLRKRIGAQNDPILIGCLKATILPALVLAQIEPQYIMSRMTFNVSALPPGKSSHFAHTLQREASSKMYSSTIFAATQLVAEMRS